MKVLVTGASGFIGSRIMQAIRSSGATAFGCSRRPIAGSITVDVADANTLKKLIEFGPFDHVIHCAGIAHRFGGVTTDEFESVNIKGTKNVAEFAAKHGAKSFVHLSSVLVYGRHGVDIDETEPCIPSDPYGSSKLRSEDAAAEIAAVSGLPITILRPAPVIGEGCKGNFARLLNSVHKGHFVMVGDGSNRKSMVYVGDLAEACVRSIRTETRSVRIFNVAAPPVSVDDLVKALSAALAKKRSPVRIPAAPLRLAASAALTFLPFPLVRSAARSLETWLSHDVYSTEAIRAELGFEAKVSTLGAVSRTAGAYLKESG